MMKGKAWSGKFGLGFRAETLVTCLHLPKSRRMGYDPDVAWLALKIHSDPKLDPPEDFHCPRDGCALAAQLCRNSKNKRHDFP